MDDLDTRLFWCLLPGVTAGQKRQLLEHFSALPQPDSLTDALRMSLGLLHTQLEPALASDSHPLWQHIAQQRQRLADLKCRLLQLGDSDYPPLLAEIPDPPVHLFVCGDLQRLRWPQFAIVGSRNCSQAGLREAGQFGKALAECGFTLTSGLAAGIDAAAHRAALHTRAGTLAVTGAGPDVYYPECNRQLQQDIMQAHCLVSEHAPGCLPKPGHFPRRNRIISGLSTGVLVVEASSRSGSLITARLALEQGRDVFAIPGSIHEPRKRGCHSLIRQGAALISSLDDLKHELDGLLGYQVEMQQQRSGELQLGEVARKLLRKLEYDPLDLDSLAQLTGIERMQLQAALVELEMAGQVQRTLQGYVRNAT